MKKKILSIILIIIMLLGAMFALTGCGSEEKQSSESSKSSKEESKKTDDISGYSYIEETDDSLLDLKSNGTFKYYQDKDELTDNYYEGTYTVYNGEDAVEYIANDLEKYGVTEEEQRDYFSRNAGKEMYKVDNYYCLVLKNKKCIIDGENTLTKTVETPYFGFYYKGTLNITNMKSANIYNFVKEK